MNENTATMTETALSASRINRVIMGFGIAAPIAYLLLLGLRPFPGDVLLKSSMCLLLGVLAWRERERLLALALLCSAAGDAFLAIDGQRWFVPGLASFLITHLVYMVIFVRFTKAQRAALVGWRKFALVAIPLFAVSFAAILSPRLGGLTVPVVIYMVAIVTMAVLSLRVEAWIVPVGAVLFMASDSLIALGKFLWSAPWLGPATWITYAAAQLLIVYGLLAIRREDDER